MICASFLGSSAFTSLANSCWSWREYEGIGRQANFTSTVGVWDAQLATARIMSPTEKLKVAG